MKLLVFISSLATGGAERVTVNLANHWAQTDWEITIVTLARQSEDFYALHPAVKRIALDLAGDSSGVVAGIRQNWRRVHVLRQILRQVRPDVALGMMSTSNVLLALAGRGMGQLRLFGSERCYPPHFPLGKAWNALRRTSYGRLDAVVAQTHECAVWLRNHTAARHVCVIPNAASYPLPSGAPHIAPADVTAPGRNILLSVGRLSAEKNFDGLIDAFDAVAARHPDWDLVILGEGPARRDLEARIGRSAFAPRMHLPGIAGNVGEWYARSGLYVLASHSEGFPNTLAEAMAHGMPVVSADCDTGPRDIIRNGIDGLLVPPRDAAQLRMALDRMLGDGQARKTFAAHAVEARERFSLDTIASRWEALFATGRCAP